MITEDTRKKEFVAVRMEADLFRRLKEAADKEGIDLSACIRKLCSDGLDEAQ